MTAEKELTMRNNNNHNDDNNDDFDDFDEEFEDEFEDEFAAEGAFDADEFDEDGDDLANQFIQSKSKKPSKIINLDAEQLQSTPTRELIPAMPMHLTAPGVNLGAYINTVHQIPILTPEEERELAHRYYDDGDVEAARLLVMSHLRFVIHIARSYSGYGLNQADLIQEGNLGLMKAVKRFDPNKGVRLVSFAVHWIKAEIHEFVIKNWRIVKVATTKAHRKLFFNLRSLKKSSNQLTLEEAEAIAKDLNVTVKQVLEMESRLTSYDASFELQDSDEEDGRYAPQLFLEDAIDPANVVEEADWEENTNHALATAMESLDERSRDIINQRWLADQKSTLHELAAQYNISAERVRQIEKNAMDKIKSAMMIDNMILDDNDY